MDYDAKLNQFFDAEEFYNVNLLSQRERERETIANKCIIIG